MYIARGTMIESSKVDLPAYGSYASVAPPNAQFSFALWQEASDTSEDHASQTAIKVLTAMRTEQESDGD